MNQIVVLGERQHEETFSYLLDMVGLGTDTRVTTARMVQYHRLEASDRAIPSSRSQRDQLGSMRIKFGLGSLVGVWRCKSV
jgi:hypothetical protein